MIKYNFKVEVSFRDKTNNLKEVKKGTVIEVTEERLQQLNAAEVGRVISAKYVEDKPEENTKKEKSKTDNNETKNKKDSKKEKTVEENKETSSEE